MSEQASQLMKNDDFKNKFFILIIARYIYSFLKMKFRVISLASKFNCRIDSTARIFFDNEGDFSLSKDVYIGANTVIYCTNEDSANQKASRIEIGEGTYVGEMNNIRVGGGFIKIGKKCLISQHVSIIGSNHSIDRNNYIMDQPWDDEKIDVVIEDDVWIGCGAKILPGVCIGEGAIVGAGSVVTKNIAAYSIVAGIPARFIKERP